MTTITDNFNRADSSTSLGSSSEGWSWTAVTGTWGISTNRAYAPSQAGTIMARAESDLGSADHYAQITVADYGSAPGITLGGPAVRFSASAQTFYVYVWRSASSLMTLYKCVSGTFTILGTGSGSHANGDVLKLVANGTSLTAYKNGTSDISLTDSSISTNSRAGMTINVGNALGYLDDFSAGTLGGAAHPLFRRSGLNGLGSGGPFFNNPLGRSMLGWVPTLNGLLIPDRKLVRA